MKITKQQLRRMILNEVRTLNEFVSSKHYDKLSRMERNLPTGGLGNDALHAIAEALYDSKGLFLDDPGGPYMALQLINSHSADPKQAAIRLAEKFKTMYGKDLDTYLESYMSADELDEPMGGSRDDGKELESFQDMINAFAGTGVS